MDFHSGTCNNPGFWKPRLRLGPKALLTIRIAHVGYFAWNIVLPLRATKHQGPTGPTGPKGPIKLLTRQHELFPKDVWNMLWFFSQRTHVLF